MLFSHINIIQSLQSISETTNRIHIMNQKGPREWKVPRYSDKFKDVLERAEKRQQMKLQQQKIQYKPPFFYRVKSIGVGAFSFVYLVIEENSGLIFAQKAIHKKKVSEQLFTEIKLHLTLKHPNIIALHHIYSEEDYIHLIMDYAGDSLFSLRRNEILPKKLTLLEIKPIFYQLVSAVKYLHDHNIVHGDIKLENVLIINGVVKLCDFGFAKTIKSNQFQQKLVDPQKQLGIFKNTVNKAVVGTLEYLSPEYIQGKFDGKPKDIWALGIICYQMIFGCNPLDGIPENEKWARMLSISQLPILQKSTIPKQISDFLENTLCEVQIRMSCSQLMNLDLLKNSEMQIRQELQKIEEDFSFS